MKQWKKTKPACLTQIFLWRSYSSQFWPFFLLPLFFRVGGWGGYFCIMSAKSMMHIQSLAYQRMKFKCHWVFQIRVCFYEWKRKSQSLSAFFRWPFYCILVKGSQERFIYFLNSTNITAPQMCSNVFFMYCFWTNHSRMYLYYTCPLLFTCHNNFTSPLGFLQISKSFSSFLLSICKYGRCCVKFGNSESRH